MTDEIIGRNEELGFIDAFLAQTFERPAALVLEGQAGIGKSTLWRAGVHAARVREFRVLSAQPAQAEQGLAHAGLGDLFENVLETVLPALSPPRRRALEVALLVEDADHVVDPRTLGVAVRSALEVLLDEEPIVVAVDDVQWLDLSSARALAFALRRLRERSILLLLARRVDDEGVATELEEAIGTGRVERLSIGPLSIGATHRLLQARLGQTFSRPTLLRVHESSGGNPFYALEFARVLVGGVVEPMHPLRVPETLEGLVRTRLDGLPAATRGALLLVSAVGRPPTKLLADLDVTEKVLDPARAVHVIEQADGTVQFTHPLLASVVYQSASERERRRAHARVAAVVVDPLDRARHLALSTESSDTEIAAVLESAATLASARGAPILAAELGEHALRLTPPEAHDDRHRRALAAARAHIAAGEGARARTITADLLVRTPAGPLRAEALLLLAETENLDRFVDLYEEALTESVTRLELQALIHRRLASMGRLTKGRAWAEEHARTSLELAESLDNPSLRACALSVLGALRFDRGDPDGPALAERAYEAAAGVDDPELLKEASWAMVHILVWSVETDRARAMLESQYSEWSERDEPLAGEALWYLSLVELRAGRWSLAAEYADRAREVNLQYGLDIPQLYLPIALVATHRGELERARAATGRLAELADTHGAPFPAPMGLSGILDLWDGDATAAAVSFALAEERADASGWGEPSMRWWRGDYVESLLALSRIGDAVALLDAWEANAVRVGREWVLAQVTRCRGLVAAAQGDVEHAASLLEQAITEHEAVGDPFGRARALLALGVVRRRARQKRAAREAIDAALVGFEDLGAATWVTKASAELGHIGGRAREEGLTPAERRVADLVAEGRTNREVAAMLFLGERTVASHLTHIYAKLGLRSRTELARRLQ